METAYAPQRKPRGGNITAKNSFQRELEAKMKDRRHAGLAADVTPSISERDSDEGLASDDGKSEQLHLIIISYIYIVPITFLHAYKL